MKLAYIEASGFRGYRKKFRVDFGERFTVIDGRNGTGKSTVFDAIEFAMTGRIAKYNEAKADGESAADYVWWKGDNFGVAERYVEVGFLDDGRSIAIRRTPLAPPDERSMRELLSAICDERAAPKEPLRQICAAAIIRDEHITSLSMDLREIDRYALLRNALGATDASDWIDRAHRLVNSAGQREKAANSSVAIANGEHTIALRHLDEIRAGIVEERAIAEAAERLRRFSGSSQPINEIAARVRERLVENESAIAKIAELSGDAESIRIARSRLPQLRLAVERAEARLADATAAVGRLPAEGHGETMPLLSVAQSIVQLVAIGRALGLRDGHCPLCAAEQTEKAFADGLAAAEAAARALDEAAANAQAIAERRRLAQAELLADQEALELVADEYREVRRQIEEFERVASTLGADGDADPDALQELASQLATVSGAARSDLKVIESLRFNAAMDAAMSALEAATARVKLAQDAFGVAQRVASVTKAIHDATRRAAAETLDQRLERVLPLMAELYRRLRPHPTWCDIEYSIRGDVQRFLKLKVGEDLNPQFLFSSGQRRATGIAFLLAVNLSLSWSRWKSILLDDPVQHVDDFRAVHLAEVAAQLVNDGRQIVCAVEDAALADLLCRRLPVERAGQGRRVTLGHDGEGAITAEEERELSPFLSNALVGLNEERAAG